MIDKGTEICLVSSVSETAQYYNNELSSILIWLNRARVKLSIKRQKTLKYFEIEMERSKRSIYKCLSSKFNISTSNSMAHTLILRIWYCVPCPIFQHDLSVLARSFTLPCLCYLLQINQTVPLMGRNGILGDQKDNFFCDVVAGQGSMCGRFFVITQSGLLCEFNEKRLLDKWVELMVRE